MTVYIDMDGVIVNLGDTLTSKVNELLNNPEKITSKSTLKLVNKINNHEEKHLYKINVDLMKNVFIKKDIVGLNKFEKLISNLSYKPLVNTKELWANLPKESEADKLINFLIQKFGKENLRILSAPVDEDSILGKKLWLQKHYPFLLKTALFEKEKYIHCKPNDILIDDRPKNINCWELENGIGILHVNVEATIKELDSI